MKASPRTEAPDDLSTLDTARELGLAVRSVQLMADRGELEAWKTPGGHRRISRESVERWKRRHRPQEADKRSAPPAATQDAGPPRVLLIEDSMHYQNLVGMLLRKQFPGVEFHVAGDGIAGLAMTGQLRPKVLIVDILLPGIDGAALITSLRSHPQFKDIGLIVVTSLDEADRAPYAFALEGVPVVHKPRLVAELPARLGALLGIDASAPRAPEDSAA